MHVPRIIYKEAIYTYIYIQLMYVCIQNNQNPSEITKHPQKHVKKQSKIIKNKPKSPNILKKTYFKTIRTHRKKRNS